ncbi:MAG: mechanosensitive ion channel [Salinisphaera sp.]|jgi:small-conductance mechanosensitive channel|nr:mechanosensitive ion channel [Salinisphaera sp.]
MHQFRASRRVQRAWLHGFALSLISLFLALSAFSVHAATANNSAASSQSVSLDQLANILENDKTRNELVSELRQAAAQNAGQKHKGNEQAQKSATATPKTSGHDATQQTSDARPQHAGQSQRMSFARQFAATTAAWAESISDVAAGGWQRVTALADSGAGGKPGARINWDGFLQSVFIFAVVAAATCIAFLVLRALAAGLFSRVARLPDGAGTRRSLLLRRVIAIIIGILIDVAIVFVAGGIGYAVGLYGVGDQGSVGTRQSLFINAFVLIELIKVAVRAIFAERYENLRPLHMSPEVAAWWSIRLRWFVGVIGYSLLVIVPILNQQLTYFVGAVVTFLVMGAAYIYALIVMFRNHRLLSARLRELADHASLGFFSVLYRLFARIWIVLALAYFTTLFVVSQLYPAQALPAMLKASVETLVVAVVCFGISGLLSRTIGYRITFSDSTRERLPMLERRLNSYVPNALKVVRVVILVLFVAVTMTIWHLFNFSAWLGTDIGVRVVSAALHVALILIAAAVVWVVVASMIEHRMSPNTGHGAPSARQQTLLTLFRNALAILIAGFTALICLSQIGVNIGPLIAGAGVFGLAIGFGAQSLVKDIITGVFIQLENAMNTGDVVSVGGVTGTAERLTIRSVSIRDIDGTYHIVPFSSANVVSNYMRDWSYFRTEYRIAYREDIDNAVSYLREAFKDLKADEAAGPNILEDMTVPGVTELADSSVKIRIMIKTKPGTQWGVGRAFNRLVKIHFDRADILIPFPHQTVWFGEDRSGEAPAANLRVIDNDEDETPRRLRRRRRGDDAAPDETGDAPN